MSNLMSISNISASKFVRSKFKPLEANNIQSNQGDNIDNEKNTTTWFGAAIVNDTLLAIYYLIYPLTKNIFKCVAILEKNLEENLEIALTSYDEIVNNDFNRIDNITEKIKLLENFGRELQDIQRHFRRYLNSDKGQEALEKLTRLRFKNVEKIIDIMLKTQSSSSTDSSDSLRLSCESAFPTRISEVPDDTSVESSVSSDDSSSFNINDNNRRVPASNNNHLTDKIYTPEEIIKYITTKGCDIKTIKGCMQAADLCEYAASKSKDIIATQFLDERNKLLNLARYGHWETKLNLDFNLLNEEIPLMTTEETSLAEEMIDWYSKNLIGEEEDANAYRTRMKKEFKEKIIELYRPGDLENTEGHTKLKDSVELNGNSLIGITRYQIKRMTRKEFMRQTDNEKTNNPLFYDECTQKFLLYTYNKDYVEQEIISSNCNHSQNNEENLINEPIQYSKLCTLFGDENVYLEGFINNNENIKLMKFLNAGDLNEYTLFSKVTVKKINAENGLSKIEFGVVHPILLYLMNTYFPNIDSTALNTSYFSIFVNDYRGYIDNKEKIDQILLKVYQSHKTFNIHIETIVKNENGETIVQIDNRNNLVSISADMNQIPPAICK